MMNLSNEDIKIYLNDFGIGCLLFLNGLEYIFCATKPWKNFWHYYITNIKSFKTKIYYQTFFNSMFKLYRLLLIEIT